jgi:DNA-directed RNA polymerase subunit F
MTEVYLKLSELRDAAEQLRQSSRQIEQSLTHVSDTIRELVVLGMDEQHLHLFGRTQVLQMTNWTQRLNYFADHLQSAADDVENAVHHSLRLLPYFDLSLLPEHEQIELAPVNGTASLDTGGWFVSSANQALFLTFQDKQTALAEHQSERTQLIEQHQAVFSELQATRNRALSHDPNLDLNHVPRVQALEAQITKLDGQIAQVNTEILGLKNEVHSLSSRFESVQPTAGADLKYIAQMDGSMTNPHVVSNTYDCVNYIVKKLPIPHNMALDAHMWNDLALSHPEYGIRIGDKPLEGAVIVLEREHSYADNIRGHLLYVESVSNGEIWVTDNNHASPIRFSDITSEITGNNISYLYFPWHTLA